MKPDRTDESPTTPTPELLQLGVLTDAVLDVEVEAESGDDVSRRRFLGTVGAAASFALAGGAGCIRPAPARKILPYTTQPDEVTPGVPKHYASAAALGGYGAGILVRSNEGRPTKVEGNPDHPSSLGGASVHSLAAILDLYDPDRSRGVTHRGLASSVDLATNATRKALDAQKAKGGSGLRILTETVTSPSLAAQIGKLLETFPSARWVQHDAAGQENVREGTRKAFGKPLSVVYDFAKADVILSLDADFLSTGPGAVRYSRDYADRRKIRHDGKNAAEITAGSKKEGVQPDQLNRLYAVECMPTPTGSVADHRFALPAGLIESFARAVAAELGVAGAPAAGALPDAVKAWIKPLADDLKSKKGKSIVVAGDHQPASLHALAAAINANLDNLGKTVTLINSVEARPEGKVDNLATLAKDMADKKVEVLLVLGGNPAHTASVDVPFTAGLKNVGFKLHLGTHVDETAVLCEWHVNESHFLETWGDIRGHDGTASVQQPLIAPLYHGRSALEFVAALVGAPQREGLDIVQAFWSNPEAVAKVFPGLAKPEVFDMYWDESTQSGVLAGTAAKPETVALAGTWSAGAPTPPSLPGEKDLEINFRLDPSLYDGRYANNGWLQELPKPVTKITWDNAAFMSEATAKRLGVAKDFRWTGGEHGRTEVSIVELEHRGKKVLAPAWILPGHPDNAVTVHLGYGRTRAGKVNATADEPNAAGEPIRGFNAYSLRTSDAPSFAPGLTVNTTGKTYYLACTQANWITTQTDPITGHEMDRKPARFGTLAEYKKEPAFAKVPPMAAGETKEINQNVPGPRHDHPHGKDEKAGDHGHAHQLTMYHDDPDEKFKRFTPGLKPEQQRRWAMAIDLSSCTGCSACVVACVSENNIPVVGKYEVTRGRELHWIRIDRYYTGKVNDPNGVATLFQPVMCVQCENAPCEIVCPVGATVHSADGLNDMAYNRCVGTRYCSNNCPYKVRRFNFLSFSDWDTNTLKLGRNPDVSVRSRGVMEKCTFCVQRIRGAEIVAEREHRKIKDGEILTACQSACPSAAIMFGDLHDSHSAVSKWKSEPRNYGLLAELNTRPRLTHLAVVRNPNPAMPKNEK